MATQIEALAYGHPDWGGIVIGGTNAGLYSLMGWRFSDTEKTRQISATVAVHGIANVAPFIAAIGKQTGNLGLTTSEGAKSITCSTSTPSGGINGTQEVQLSRVSGASFSATDIGLPISLGGGTMAQIANVINANTAIASVIAGGSFSFGIGSIVCSIGSALISCRDQGRLTGGIPLKVGGIKARTSVSRSGNGDDDKTRRLFEISIVFERPAKEVKTDDSTRPHVRDAAVDRLIDLSGLMTLSFSGTITAGTNTSSVGQYAYSLLAESVTTWTTAQLAIIAAGRTMEQVSDGRDVWDEEASLLRFDRVFRELNEADLVGVTDDPRIKGANLLFRRSYTNAHGIRGATTPFNVSVSYSASITAKGANATTPDNLPALWKTVIKPNIIKRVKALFGGSPVILRSTDPVIDPVTSKIFADIFVFVAGSGSNIYTYSRSSRMQLSAELDIGRIWDGEPMTYYMWSPGMKLVGFVDVNMVQVGKPVALSGGQGNPLVDQNSLAELLGIFDLNKGGFTLSFSGPGFGGSAEASPNNAEPFPTPGDPSRFFGGLTPSDGSWQFLGLVAGDSPTYWGQDPDNVGNTVEVNSYQYSGVYLYVRKTSKGEPKAPRVPTGGIERSSRSSTVERFGSGYSGNTP